MMQDDSEFEAGPDDMTVESRLDIKSSYIPDNPCDADCEGGHRVTLDIGPIPIHIGELVFNLNIPAQVVMIPCSAKNGEIAIHLDCTVTDQWIQKANETSIQALDGHSLN